MAVTVVGGSRGSAVTLTNFSMPNSGITSNPGATESQRQTIMRAAGTFSMMSVNFDANGTARTLQLRKNSANGTLAVSPTNSTAGVFSDLTHTDSVVAGDTIGYQYNGTAPAYIANAVTMLFSATSGTVALYGQLNGTPSAASPYMSMAGAYNATEANMKSLIRAPGTVSNLLLGVVTSAADATTLVSRKNGGAGNLTVTVAGGSTGKFEDTTNTDVLVSGDTYNFKGSSAGATFCTFQTTIHMTHTTVASELTQNGGNITFSASNMFTVIYANTFSNISATESTQQNRLNFEGRLTNFRLFLSSNTLTSTVTISLRKNGATGNNALSIGAGATGTFEDTTHTDYFIATDLLGILQSGGGSGVGSCNWGMLTVTPTVNPVAPVLESSYLVARKRIGDY